MTSGSDWQPLPSGRPPKTAPLSVRTRYGLEWMERRRWSQLRSTDVGSVAFMAYHETRYLALKTALLALLEAEDLRPLEDGDPIG
jgi:hypothetical protein